MISNSDFVHCHCHTEFSSFDGLNKTSELVLEARKMGFKSLAITDHGNIGGWGRFFAECKRKKDKNDKEIPYPTIKPILGCEFYLSKNIHSRGMIEQPDGRKGNRHILLIAKNEKGWENISTLSQRSFIEGRAFGDPRIDLELLSQYHDGIILSSACLSSVINNNLLKGRYDQAKKSCMIFKDIFGDDFYLEAMYHGIEEEGVIIPDIIKLGKEMNVKIICSNDCHYCKKEQARSHELLMAMSTSKCLKDPNRYAFPYDEFYLKNAEEMSQIFPREMLLNTVSLSEKVEDFFKPGVMRLPKFDIERAKQEKISIDLNKKYEITQERSDFYSSYKFLIQLAHEGMKKHGLDKSKEHVDRLKMELEDIKVAWDSNKMDFATYFLMVWQGVNYAKKNNIIVGPGRGSGYASLLLKVLDVTYGLDPVKFGLLWERFLAFGDAYFVSDNDFGIGDNQYIDVDDLLNNEDSELDEEREIENDEGGVDRY